MNQTDIMLCGQCMQHQISLYHKETPFLTRSVVFRVSSPLQLVDNSNIQKCSQSQELSIGEGKTFNLMMITWVIIHSCCLKQSLFIFVSVSLFSV